MSVSQTMLKKIVTLAKKLATQEHENKRLWSSNMQLQVVRDSKAKQLREAEQELQRLRQVHMEFQSEELTEARATIADLQQQLDAARAEIETLRRGLADAKRAASDEFTERQVLTVEQQQDAAIWQQQVDSANAEIANLRQQLDAARAEIVDVRRQRNNETDRLNATNAVSVQQRDEIAYLRARLDEERSVIAGVREKLTAAEAAVTLQRARIERLQKCVGKVRSIMDREYDGLEFEHISGALVGLDAEPTPVAEPAPCPECERLQAFVENVRELLAIPLAQISYDHMSVVRAELAALDAEPTPVAEPLDAEGGE